MNTGPFLSDAVVLGYIKDAEDHYLVALNGSMNGYTVCPPFFMIDGKQFNAGCSIGTKNGIEYRYYTLSALDKNSV